MLAQQAVCKRSRPGSSAPPFEGQKALDALSADGFTSCVAEGPVQRPDAKRGCRGWPSNACRAWPSDPWPNLMEGRCWGHWWQQSGNEDLAFGVCTLLQVEM
jgi:hypothetical protein